MALYALEPLKPIMRVNFPDDRIYTHNSILEELILTEKHTRDQSWSICSCLSEKHLVALSALASEGYGFADSPEEKKFMNDLMVRARVFRDDIKKGKIRKQEDFELIRQWSREARHRIEGKNWSGEWSRFETPELVEVVTQVHALTGDIPLLEEEQVDRILTILSEKHGVPKPQYRFVEGCNPLKDAWMVGQDIVAKNEDGEITRIPLTDSDQLVFCRGGASPYSISHEFCHHLQRIKDGETDEKSATECGLQEVGNHLSDPPVKKSLYKLSTQESNGGIMSALEGLTEKVGDSLPLIGGVVVGEMIDASGIIDTTLQPITGTWTGLMKGIIGTLTVGTGLTMKKGAMADVIIGAGLPIAASGFTQQFFPGGIFPAARLVTPPGTTVIPIAQPQLTSYARPTGLRYGHPTLNVPMIPPRPGILTPSGIPQSLAGKFMLGGPG